MTVGRAITAEAPRIRAAQPWLISRRISASGSALSAKRVVTTAPIAAAATSM